MIFAHCYRQSHVLGFGNEDGFVLINVVIPISWYMALALL